MVSSNATVEIEKYEIKDKPLKQHDSFAVRLHAFAILLKDFYNNM